MPLIWWLRAVIAGGDRRLGALSTRNCHVHCGRNNLHCPRAGTEVTVSLVCLLTRANHVGEPHREVGKNVVGSMLHCVNTYLVLSLYQKSMSLGLEGLDERKRVIPRAGGVRRLSRVQVCWHRRSHGGTTALV